MIPRVGLVRTAAAPVLALVAVPFCVVGRGLLDLARPLAPIEEEA